MCHPRCGHRPSAKGAVFRELPSSVWKPDFEFANEVVPTNFRFLDFYALPDGTVQYTQAFTATLSTSLDLRRFPFDEQVLPLVVQAAGDDLDRTILRPDRSNTALPKRSYGGLSQWVPVSVSERLDLVEGSAARASAVDFGVNVRRNPRSYELKFIVPLLLLVIISWVTFWLSHEEFKTKDQLQSAVSTLLIIVAFNITASSLLPKTEYITYIDALLFACFIFVMISIATICRDASLASQTLAGSSASDSAGGRHRLPIAFIITQAILFLEFRIGG